MILEFIFLIPTIAVVLVLVVIRYLIRKRPWGMSACLGIPLILASAICMPVASGVWVLDFLGSTNELAKTSTASGHEIRVIQQWNYVDFYTTSVQITAPDGTVNETVIDGDDGKRWKATISINPASQIATIASPASPKKTVSW